MPLYDKGWEKGKCGFKLIQYMASKLPVIASPVGINSDLILNGKNIRRRKKNENRFYQEFDKR